MKYDEERIREEGRREGVCEGMRKTGREIKRMRSRQNTGDDGVMGENRREESENNKGLISEDGIENGNCK